MKKIIILGLIFIVSPFLLFAHNPLSSKYHLNVGENISLLTVNLSQTGVEQMLLKSYKTEELKAMSPKEFKELIIEYVKSNFLVSIDGKRIILKKGGIKLGTHQTDLKFVLEPLSKTSKKIAVNIPAFKENGEHQTIFLLDFNGKRERAILSSKNNYKADINLSEEENSFIWIVLSIILVFFVFVIIRKRFLIARR